MDKSFVSNIKKHLSERKKIVVIPHLSPDADALGSCLAIYHFFNKNHEVSIISPNEYSEALKFLPGEDIIERFDLSKDKCVKLINNAEIIFVLDFNNLNRIRRLSPYINESNAIKIMIDHHESPDNFATYSYCEPTMSSTCEMIYNLLSDYDKDLINKSIAECIYTGIVADTGSFRFPSTSSKTLKIASELIELGVEIDSIYQNLFNNYQFSRLKLLGKTLENFKKVKGLPVMYSLLSDEDQKRNNYKKGDTEGFVNFGLSIEGVLCSVLMIEKKDEGVVKLSFRSKGEVSVNDFAANFFNGGGHINAAGGVSHLSLAETEEKFLKDILTHLKS
ncbi:MAG: DHH family phosphoesterase [Candidatus Marisimplicoccus sp.]